MISTDIARAAEILSNEDIIGMPTETVYGLAGNAWSENAIRKIFAVKKRPANNPLIVHLKNQQDLKLAASDIPEQAYRLADAFWPGPLTLVLKKQPAIPALVTAGQDTVAVRVPRHPVALELLNRLDFPLAAPSANPFTQISPTKATHVAGYFAKQIDMVLDGGTCHAGIESTIVGFENGEAVLYRLGALPVEAIENVVGPLRFKEASCTQTVTPGMQLKHYAPQTRLLLTATMAQTVASFSGKNIGLLLFDQLIENVDHRRQFVLSPTGDLQQAASRLYETLHLMDREKFELILAGYFPDKGLGKSINDRLKRAAAQSEEIVTL